MEPWSRPGARSFGKPGYGGPCPPQGAKPHRYIFTVYALKVPKLDVGAGAQDDGAGVVTVMEAARRIGEMKRKPRRSLRVVLFANEEFGLSNELVKKLSPRQRALLRLTLFLHDIAKSGGIEGHAERGVPIADRILELAREMGQLVKLLPHMRGLQLNVVCPDPEAVRSFTEGVGQRVEVILQINHTSLVKTAVPPAKLGHPCDYALGYARWSGAGHRPSR